MANEKVNATLQKEIEGVIVDLMAQTSADNVLLADGKTLAQYLAEQVPTGGITEEQMNEAIKTAIDTAIDNLVDGAPEAFDTLKEIAEWIVDHEDLYEGLVSGIAEIKGGLETHTGNGAVHVTAAEKAKIQSSGRIFCGKEIPEDFTENDLFFKILD